MAMAHNVMVMAEVEPYRAIVPMIAERCRGRALAPGR